MGDGGYGCDGNDGSERKGSGSGDVRAPVIRVATVMVKEMQARVVLVAMVVAKAIAEVVVMKVGLTDEGSECTDLSGDCTIDRFRC